MTALVWGAIFGGLAIVILAIGIPYYITHRHWRPHYDHFEGQRYLQAKRRWYQRHPRSRIPQAAQASSRESGAESSRGGA